MLSDMNGSAVARQRWRKHPNGLSAPVRAVFTAWEQCQAAEQDEALNQMLASYSLSTKADIKRIIKKNE